MILFFLKMTPKLQIRAHQMGPYGPMGLCSENLHHILGVSPPGISEKTSPVLRVGDPPQGHFFSKKKGVPFFRKGTFPELVVSWQNGTMF